jgi:hypothetical protein
MATRDRKLYFKITEQSSTLKFFSARTHKVTTHAIPYNIITTLISEVHFNKYCLPTLDFLPGISKLKDFMCLLLRQACNTRRPFPAPRFLILKPVYEEEG